MGPSFGGVKERFVLYQLQVLVSIFKSSWYLLGVQAQAFKKVVIQDFLKSNKIWGANPNISDYFEKILPTVKRVWNGNRIFPASAIFIPSFYIKCLKKMC